MIAWIASYPRSGNTLVRLLLKQAFHICTYSQYNDAQDVGADPEMAAVVGHVSYEDTWNEFYERASREQALYAIKTHDRPPDDCKAIYVVRDGRATVVSYQHYLQVFSSLKSSLSEIILGGVPFGGWSDHIDAWQPASRPNTLFLKYEDLVRDPESGMQAISRFLELPVKGVALSTFAEMNARFPAFFRSGSNDRNIAELDKSHAALFDLFHGPKMAALGYQAGVADYRATTLRPALIELQERLRGYVGQHYQLAERQERIQVLERGLAHSQEVSRERQERINTLEEQHAVLKWQLGTSQQLAKERQESIERLQKRCAEATALAEFRAGKVERLEEEVLGGPLTLFRARRRIRRALRQPGAAPAGPAHAHVARATTHSAEVNTLVPEQFRRWPAQSTPGGAPRDFGIAIFGHSRPHLIESALTSLAHQDALNRVHVFLDGDQGRPDVRRKVEQVATVVERFPVRALHRRNGNLGFRKLILQSMKYMSEHYDSMLFLEDDCFPTRGCVEVFRADLDLIRDRKDVFSVYGHPFNVPNETEYFGRFQGWGWATTAEKLGPILADLVHCYWMSEEDFLQFTGEAMTEEVLSRIDVTPGRQPSATLRRFFAWDETLCLLTALRGLLHKRSSRRVIYNCGVDSEGAHFNNVEFYRAPPFSMVTGAEAWEHF